MNLANDGADPPARRPVEPAEAIIREWTSMCAKKVFLKIFDSPSTRRRGGALGVWLLGALISASLSGCSKKSEATSAAPPTASTPGEQSTPGTSTAPVPSVLAAWVTGDQPSSVQKFVETDWTARPLFAPGSTLGLPEAKFKTLSAAEREAKFTEVVPQTTALKALARAVIQAGREAAAKKDAVQARKCFVSLRQCGEALDTLETLTSVKFIGQGMKRMAETELTKLGP